MRLFGINIYLGAKPKAKEVQLKKIEKAKQKRERILARNRNVQQRIK